MKIMAEGVRWKNQVHGRSAFSESLCESLSSNECRLMLLPAAAAAAASPTGGECRPLGDCRPLGERRPLGDVLR